MSFAPRRIAAFSSAVAAMLVICFAVPTPYPEGVAVDRATGRPEPQPWRQLASLRQSGDVGTLRSGLERLPSDQVPATVVQGLTSMVHDELDAPDLTQDALATAPIETYFVGVEAGLDRLDARAAVLQQRRQRGEPLRAGELLSLAEAFRQQGRSRAQWRWLARAFAKFPGNSLAADGLLSLCLANGRLEDALQVVEQHTADRTQDAGWQRHLAQLGAWLGKPDLEIQALEHLVAKEPDPVDRSRLISLYSYLGTPEKALPHAVALVDGAAEIAAAEEAAGSALRAGFVDQGLSMLRRAAERAPDASPWLQRFAELALQDLRVPEVATALASAVALDSATADQELEALYRRTDQPELLADLLQQRLLRSPANAALWHEVTALRYALGQRAEAQALAAQRDLALADPERFLASLPPELRAQAGAVRQEALSLALARGGDGSVVGETLERLRPFLEQPGFRALAETLLAQHPNDPRAKAMRRELVDMGRTPLAAEQAAAALSATYPDDVELARFWLERAQWSDQQKAQLAARTRLLALVPDDHANRYELADLLEFTGDRKAALGHWQALVEAEGLTAPAVPRLVDTLFALGDENGAVEWLQRLAAAKDATPLQRSQAADELFYRRSYDRARVLYAAVLAEQPDDPHALLRMGQIAAWTNDPRSALPYFERHLAVTDADRAMVQFYLGETLWSLGESTRARTLHEQALAELQKVPAPDFTTRSTIATTMARLGQRGAAATAYRQLVAESPRDVDLVLDYADVLLQSGELDHVRALLHHAEVLAPEHVRVLRMTGEVAARSGDFVAAERAFARTLEVVGSDAGVLGDLGQIRLAAGDWRGAQQSVAHWLDLQPDSIAAQRTNRQLAELLGDLGATEVRYQKVGRDRSLEASVGGVLQLGERSWLQGRWSARQQSGVTSLVAGKVDADYQLVDAALGWRPDRSDVLAIGVSAAPGASGDLPVGLYVAGRFEWEEPVVSLQVRARWHELWNEPAAAAGLGGRQSGLEAASHWELGKGYWLAGDAGFDLLEIDGRSAGHLSDSRLRGEVSIGCRLVDGDVGVTSEFDPRVVPAGPSSPFLAASPNVTRPWLCNAWLSWRTAQLLGDAALAGPLPLVAHDEHLVGTLRLDRHLARDFGASATGYGGFDLRTGQSIYGVEAALTWRPAFGSEFTVSGSHGAALGRADGGDVDALQLQVVLRW